MTSTRAINAAAGVILACLQQGKLLPASQAYALDSAGLLNSPEHAAEVAALRARVAELEPYEVLNPQQCPKGLHADWLVDPENTSGCPWCRVAELETLAHGCDGEGCILPHSSWCERAKQAAAENSGCTCPQPWKGTPQPHAGYCWLVSPPRDEVEKLRARVVELEAAAYGDAEVRLLAPVEQIRHLHACVAAQLARADTLDRLLREYQAAAPPLPVVASCLGCGEGLDDENISDFCSDRCAEAGSNRPVDEDPIAYSLTVEALHASSGAVIETPARPRPVPHDLPEVTP